LYRKAITMPLFSVFKAVEFYKYFFMQPQPGPSFPKKLSILL
jgi:hypothetical protein